MWEKPWKLKEGFGICAGLFVIGLALQFSVGGVEWQGFTSPVNVIALAAYIAALCVLYACRSRIYFVRWAMLYHAAVPAIASLVALTLIMGLVRQVPSHIPQTDPIGFSKMLSFQPFVLLYAWATTILGLVTIKHLCGLRWRNVPHLLSHAGLFIALTCATLGSADMQRLTMQIRPGHAEWRGIDSQGNIHELPVAIELKEFKIDEYPPKLMLIDNETGDALPRKKPEHVLADSTAKSGNLPGWEISIEKILDYAAPVMTADTTNYVEWQTVGSTSAVYVKAASADGKIRKEGWVSNGSFMFPYNALRLTDRQSIVMPDREPRKFSSDVIIYTKSGDAFRTVIEVNKPATAEGWKIYQLSYDETKGRWSEISIVELVSDPWLPFVYAGIALMAAGAVCMFAMSQKRKEETE